MFGQRPVVSSLQGMVVAAHPHAAAAGARILRSGGNAFDAIVATAATLNVVEPFMSGLAGLGMATMWSAQDQAVRTLDFVSAVPNDVDPQQLTRADIFHGRKASAPPGSLAGWAEIHRRYGQLPFAQLLAPAIELARGGYPVTDGIPYMNADWFDLHHTDAEWLRTYTNGTEHVEVGWVLRQPDLGDTLTAIAQHGPGYLYDGPLGEKMVAHLRAGGASLAIEDLRQVAPKWLEPIAVQYRDLNIHTLAPPAESFQFLLTLGALQHVDFSRIDANSTEHLDRVCRAVRLAAELRIQHNKADRQTIRRLLSDQHLQALGRQVLDNEVLSGRTQRWEPVTDPALINMREHTTSFSAADAQGNMICITQSLGSVYGSGVVIPNTGVCMNNFLNWGDVNPNSPNFLTGGAQIAMCLAPTISLRDGQPVLALGTPGSYGILQTQAQAIVQYMDYQLDLQRALEAPRFRAYDGSNIAVEGRVHADVVDGLRSRGHSVQVVEPWTAKMGGLHAISRDPQTGVLTGAADPRRDGYAVMP